MTEEEVFIHPLAESDVLVDVDTPTGEPRGILLSSPDCSVFMELPPTVSRIASQQY